ncbi:MAG: TonB-dependent receptor [Alistipes sp.]|nr:TonB-dependent receptor [Alistipes sp.]
MRKIISLIFALFTLLAASAQEVDDYRLYKFDSQQLSFDLPLTDTLLFYRAMHDKRDLFEEITAYRFSAVEYARRGFYFTERAATLDGLSLRHSNISILRRLGLTERAYGGISHGNNNIAGLTGEDEFSAVEGVPLDGVNVGAFFSGRGYLGGARATLHSYLRDGWSMSLYASTRGGEDLYVKGVYNNSIDAAVRLSKSFDTGAMFSLLALSNVGERGLRSGSTEEAFTLTGDKLYNPSWGHQAGDVRNSRVRKEAVPFLAATLSMPVGGATQMTLSVGGDYGVRRYSTLGWYDAMTPRPDNYRYMPSYFSSESVAEAVAEQWRECDERYTQIDWAEMYNQNRMSANGAVYAMDDRVERIARSQAVLHFRTELGPNLTIGYGVRGEFDSSRNYKQMVDLMGATHLVDLDYYLMDDDTFSNRLQNNLRSSDADIVEGERFSYDYALVQRRVMADVMVEYISNRWQLNVDMAVGMEQQLRRGYFEKELFPGENSYGRSAVVKFNPYTVKTALGYSLSARHNIRLSAMIAGVAPDVENLFLNPQYNNRLVDNPVAERHLAAEIDYRYKSTAVNLLLSAYFTMTDNERQVFRAYDDLSATYCDVDIAGLGTARYGVEAVAEVRLSRVLRASFSAAAGRYVYSKNPYVTHYADTDNSVVSSRSQSYMGDCFVGGAPMVSGTAELTYLTYRGWAASLGVQVAALRYVDPSLIRRTERVAYQASSSEEIFQRFIEQRRLNDVSTVDASVSKWFNIGRSRLSLTLSVRNLLGKDDIIYGGYESSRIRNYMSGARRIYTPQDDVLTYAYPRTYYAVVAWKF